MSRASRVGASRIGPPNSPECTACSSTAISTSQSTSPRSPTVSAGTPTFQFAESATTMTSAASWSRYVRRNSTNVGLPTSSSPSTKTVTPTGRSSPSARSAPRCAAMPALSSAEPRPYSRPSRSVGSNGSVDQSSRGPVGCTSWWAYSSTVGAPGGPSR